MSAVRYTDLTSSEVQGAIRGATLLWPVGSTEQHGPHLPLGVDSVLAEAFATAIAERVHGLVLPTVTIGARSLPQSGGGLSFPGTLYVAGPELIRYLAEVLRSISQLPFAHLVVVNGHFENEPLLLEALDEACRSGGMIDREVTAFSWWNLVDENWMRDQNAHFPGWHAEHAGHTETSLMLHLQPELVRQDRPNHDTPPPPGIYLHPIDTAAASTDGVLSRTSEASAAAGAALFDHIVQRATNGVIAGLNSTAVPPRSTSSTPALARPERRAPTASPMNSP
ncbi:creatininase family protein [Pseudonocardia sp. ICBG162]|uniref:creatininase family protein n=1 Tax=Pseudonocardia sp. ICBG162 TaxID=2846761 RepID=UPI001CF6A813|nr:creatininase family protein [Pseudonocardia sp. ICBG162]